MSLLVCDLNVAFDKPLIRQLNLHLSMGQRLVVYGSNGTGKSSLLKALVDPARIKSGSVRWDLPFNKILFLQQQMFFHSQTPDDVHSYLLNILLFKKPWTRPTREDFEKIEAVQKKLNLPNQPLKNLSGGQKQKLKIARGLLLNAQVLLLDEPFNAIDPISSSEIIQWLNEIRENSIQILVLHDLEQIERLKSDILWIQPERWEILPFEKWFLQVDQQFHSWIQSMRSPPLEVLP